MDHLNLPTTDIKKYPMHFILKNEKDTTNLGKKIANIATNGDIFCLKGKLGIGKTSLARSMIKYLTNTNEVLSPTYPLLINYEYKNSNIWHFDLYRLEKAEDIWNIGYEDALNDGIIIIEWPEIIENLLPKSKIVISLTEENNKRKAAIKANKSFINKIKNKK